MVEILSAAPIYALMAVSLSGFLTGEMTKCEYSRKLTSAQNGLYGFTAFVSLICSALFWCLSAFSFSLSFYTLWTGLLFGAAVMGQITASAFAMKIGPWAYTSVMMSLSTVIPALSGVLFWGEDLTANIVIGIILMSVCFILSVKTEEEDKEKKKGNIKWLILSIIASLCTGGIGILQKAHQTSQYKQELTTFLAVSFAFSALFSFVMMKITAPKNAEKKSVFSKKAVLLIFAAGVGTAINHLINLYLSGAMASAIFFPIMSGGELILVTLASIIIFKEKLSVKQWIGLTCGAVAVVILCF